MSGRRKDEYISIIGGRKEKGANGRQIKFRYNPTGAIVVTAH